MQLGSQLLQGGGALTTAQQRQQLPGAPALPGLPLPLQKVLQQKPRQEVELPHLVKGLGRPAAAAGQQQGATRTFSSWCQAPPGSSPPMENRSWGSPAVRHRAK